MIRLVFFSIFLFSGLSVEAFQVDSLQALLANLKGKAKIDALNKLANDHPESKARLAGEAFLHADKIGYLKGKAKSAELLGDASFENKEFKNALDYYQQSYDFFTALDSTEARLRTLKAINQTAFNLKLYAEVIDNCLQMQQLAEAVGDKSFLAYAYSRLGRIRGEKMKDLQASRDYFLKAIDLYLEINERKPLSAIYSNLAIIHFLFEQNDSTRLYLDKGIAIGKEFQQKDELRILYSLSADLHYREKDYAKALDYSRLALSIAVENERTDVVIYANLLIGKIYIAQEQYDTALNYITLATKLAEKDNDLEQVVIGYELLSNIYKEKNDLPRSIEFLEKLHPLKDTIARQSLSLSLAEKEAEFQIQKKQQELELLEKTGYQHRLLRNGIILICVLVIFILALFINRYNVIMKFQKQELDRLRIIKQLEEKEKLLLKEKLTHQEKMLASNTMHIIQKNKILSDLKSEISNLPATKSTENFNTKIKNINRAIETNMTFEDDWQKFKLQFEQVHPNFFSKLYEKFPGLANSEIRFCAYIKMGHNTKEIAQLMGVNASSVQKARYRLKKKMDLGTSVNLVDYIQNF